MRNMPSKERLERSYSYNPETGEVTSKHNNRVLSKKCKRGYLRVRVDTKSYLLHRVIWVLMTGEDPGNKCIDHINGNPSDNRWSNLRLVTQQQNNWNRRGKGIARDKRRKTSKQWRAHVRHEGKLIVIGSYECPLIARLAYEDRCRELRGDYSAV